MKPRNREQFQFQRLNYLPVIAVFVLGILVSYFIGPNRYAQRILLLIFLWAAASSAFNIISGYGGQVVFGYMMYVGTGAYTTVLLFKLLGVSPWIGMFVGMMIAVIFAFVIGLPTLRLHGAYFAIATVAFPLIAVPVLNHLGLEEIIIPFTGHGAKSMQFMDMRYYVLIGVTLLAVMLILVQMIERSRFGYALKALKQNETAAEGMGIDTYRTKMLAFTFSAALGALVGAVYPFGVLYVLTTHAVYGVFIIVRVLSISIVGGLGTVWGPLIGALFLVPLGEFLNYQFGDRYPGVQDIVYGIALIATIIYMPQGVWGKIRASFRHFVRKPVLLREPLAETPRERGMGTFDKLESMQPAPAMTNANGPILRIVGAYKSFGGVSALSDMNIEVKRGEILGIIGPNGAGKTTLFNVINGYLTPDKGRVYWEGRDVSHFKPHALCKLGVSRTFQVPQVFSNMTVLENIMIGAFNRWDNVGKACAIAEKVAEQMGLCDRAYDQAVGLTLWETKMLEFSRSLATEPKLLLVDEPMAGLNPEETNRLGEIIKVIAKSGITVMVIEHVVHSLVKIADRMLGMDEGCKIADGTPEEVISDPHIIEAYLGAKWRERHVES